MLFSPCNKEACLQDITSVQFISVVSDSLQPLGLQHARLPCPTPRAYSNSCPLNRSCHQTISSSVVPFSCLQSFPASGSFPVSWLFTSGSQSIGALASTTVPPMNIQGWFPLGLTSLISLLSKGLSIFFSSTTFESINSSVLCLLYGPTLTYMTAKKTIALIIWTFVCKVMSLLFDTLSRFVIAFLPRNNHLLISWLQSPSLHGK